MSEPREDVCGYVCGIEKQGHDEYTEGHDFISEVEVARLADEAAMEEAMRYDPSTMRDEDGPWGGGFARNH